jgi:SAM-dependent methyltransferase
MTILLDLRKVMQPPPNFDRLAAPYRWMEALSFGPWLWRCRCAFLGQMKSARRALVLGDGDGRFTARLLQENPTVRVDAVDISPAMLEALVRRAEKDGLRVKAIVADLRAWSPDPTMNEGGWGYDLVVTHFVLDCLTTDEVEGLASRIRPFLAQDAVWVVAEFVIPEGRFGRWVARPIVGMLYGVFALITGLRVRALPDHAGALERAGFQLRPPKKWLGGLLLSECWDGSGSGHRPA